jgi:non-canonical (house-cleaning) NTP pyrophosphatase
MRVAVGSGNPVKREATARVFDGARVEARPVDSGVSEQPFGRDETRRGAVVRARRALAADPDPAGSASSDAAGYDLGVGIEGGVAAVGVPAGRRSDPDPDPDSDQAPDPNRDLAVVGDDLALIMWAAVTDGRRVACGGGPTLPLPGHVGDRLRAGEELGPVMDDVLGTTGVAESQGAAGVLTGGRLSRTDALEAAVAGAAGPFLTDRY